MIVRLTSLVLMSVVFVVSLVACANQQADLETTTQVAPNSQAATYNVQLGLGYLRQGDMQRAKQKLLTAAQQDPRNPAIQGSLAYYYESAGDVQQAAQHYQQAIALAPQAGGPQNNYGAFLCRQKQYQQAEIHLLKAAQNPHYVKTAQAYENAGLCALSAGDKTKAKQYLQIALRRDSRRSAAALQLAKLAFNANDYKQARAYLADYNRFATESAQSLWLAIRLARQQGDQAAAQKFAVALKTQFKDSQEYRELQQSQGA